jgi:hypothetical protein
MSRRSDRALAFAPLTVLTVLAVLAAGFALRDSGDADRESVGRPAAEATADPAPSVAPSPAEEPQPAVSLKQARRQWDKAMVDSVLEGTGRYEWAVTAMGRTFTEEVGIFGFDPMRTSLRRTISNLDPEPGQPRELVINVIRRDKSTYMQMAGWGPWDGCWLRMSADMAPEGGISDVEGEMLDALSETPEIPSSISVALNSTVSSTRADHYPAPYVEYTAQVSLGEALAFLGVNYRILFPERDALLKARAPIVVAIGIDDRPYAVFADGARIGDALRRSGIKLDGPIFSFLDIVTAEVRFTDLGLDVEVRAPAEDLLLPRGATRDDTCPGKE